MRNLKLRLALGSALASALILASPALAEQNGLTPAPAAPAAHAQPAGASAQQSPDQEAEIVVTGARTGAQSLQRTAIAVSVIGGDAMQRQGLNTIQDLSNSVPNLSFSRNTSAAIIRIRGIGSTNAGAGSDPSVTVQVDGVYIARATGQLTDFFDVDRIEVLRGPQGTLYGRNAVGGTINVISRVPSREFTGRAQLTYGNFNTLQGDLYLSGPIAGETLRASIAGTYRRHDGYFHNIVPGAHDVGNADRGGVRGQVRWEPVANVDATTRADYSSADEYYESYDHLLSPVAFSAPLANSLIGSHRDVAINGAQTLRSRIGGVSEDINWHITDNLTLKSITAWRRTHVTAFNDNDATELNLLYLRADENDRQFSQEFSLQYVGNRFRGVAGAYYFGDTDVQENVLQQPPSVIAPPPASAVTTARANVVTHSYAAFAQGELQVVPSLTLVLGGRYTSENKSLDQFFNRTMLNPATLGTPFPSFPRAFTATRTDHAFTPRFGVNLQATPDIFLYASVARGFKSGGFNNAATAAATAGFAPEHLWSYEAGIRSQWADRRIRINLTGFYYDYSNLQVRQLLGPGNAVIGNAASATVKGLELELGATAARDLRFSANLSLLDATYNSFPTASVPGGFSAFTPNQVCVPGVCTINASGNRLDDSPHFSGTVAADYSPHVGQLVLTAHADVVWRSRAYFDPSNVLIASQKGYTLLNGNIGIGQERGWRIEAYVRNLTNQGYYQTIAGNGIVPGAIAGDPRTFGARVSFDW